MPNGVKVALLIALALSAGAVLALHRADQGYVRSTDGQVWRLKRMQTLGMGGEYVAVYGKE